MSIIVYGPQGCGKTKHAEALRAHFNCDAVVDEAEWPKGQRELAKFKAGNDLLLITADEVPAKLGTENRRIYSFEDAAAEAGINLTGQRPMDEPGYEKLGSVLMRAYDQAARGKGKERHVQGEEPFHEQVMADMAKRFGTGALLSQAFKKSEESQRLPHDRAVAELLGAINYLAGAVIDLERRESMKVVDNEPT